MPAVYVCVKFCRLFVILFYNTMHSPTGALIRLNLTLQKITLKVRFSCYVACAIKVGKLTLTQKEKNRILLEKVSLKTDKLISIIFIAKMFTLTTLKIYTQLPKKKYTNVHKVCTSHLSQVNQWQNPSRDCGDSTQ